MLSGRFCLSGSVSRCTVNVTEWDGNARIVVPSQSELNLIVLGPGEEAGAQTTPAEPEPEVLSVLVANDT